MCVCVWRGRVCVCVCGGEGEVCVCTSSTYQSFYTTMCFEMPNHGTTKSKNQSEQLALPYDPSCATPTQFC